MHNKPPEAWASDPNARALRIDLSPQRSVLLPLDQFAYAEIENPGGLHQQVRALFATHEVVIRGQCLRRLVNALQRLELSLITVSLAPVQIASPDGQPVITDVTVNKLADAQSSTFEQSTP